jgi:hypothetical protein
MKIFLILIIIFICGAFFAACSQYPRDVLLEIKKQQANGNYDDFYKYYTNDTVKTMAELDRLIEKNQTVKGKEDKRFMDGADWDVIAEKINGNDADVIIKYTDHSIENMRGLELGFKLKKEDGKWKLDMEKDLRKSMEMIKNSGQTGKAWKTDYLNKIKQSLKTGNEQED